MPDDDDLLRKLADAQLEVTRLHLLLHRVQREASRAKQPGKPGRPHKRERNDALLAIFEHQTPTHLPHMQRCRVAAYIFANEHGGKPMPETTARDAIAEALQARRGAAGARKR